ncbi:MAG: tellurite resistance protein TerB [Muribaculaceae bacterium]|nr:tellurite resistance protein TerB [Muribaculaceae bacterium]
MELNRLQLAAAVKAGKAMAAADGKIDPEELKVIAIGLQEFGIVGDETKLILALADAMEPTTMLATLSAMNEEQKKFVCGYLSTIMVCDGDIDESEMKLWQLTSTLAGFPTMTIAEANEYWSSH